ncbi:MAG: hypothetical protein IPK13_15130 [Deltaproteobacteria bacterium]|nr:hypothetical protein [Deltaproteobacteria bacterium]
MKPASAILVIVTVLLLAACGLWIFGAGIVPGWLIAALWGAALTVVLLPLALSIFDRATRRKRPR